MPLLDQLFKPLNPELPSIGMDTSTTPQIQKKPLFIPIEKQPQTPFQIISTPIKQFISGGIPAVIKNTPPPPTYREAFQQGYKGRLEDLSMEAKPGEPNYKGLNPQKVANFALSLSPDNFSSVAKNLIKNPQERNLTTKFLDYVDQKLVNNPNATLSRQEILDFAKRPELKKGETDLLNLKIKDFEGNKISGKDFADSIRRDLLELKPVKVKEPQYSRTTIDKGLTSRLESGKSPVGKNYEEVVFESPITTNGSSHYPNSKNYFAHTRGDEVVEGGKKIWREQEIQSDLIAKKGLDRMVDDTVPFRQRNSNYQLLTDEGKAELRAEVDKLRPFENDRFGERIMRERIKEKASKGYEKYRLPTGETIGKIEGFQQPNWTRMNEYGQVLRNDTQLTAKNMKVGERVSDGADNEWIITDILGDGRFKAVPKERYDHLNRSPKQDIYGSLEKQLEAEKETFDLTGKSNPQYRRYSDWGKFLKNKFGGKEITDSQGNSWIEIDIKPEYKKMPIEAFAGIPLIGGIMMKDKEEKKSSPLIKKKPLFSPLIENAIKELIPQKEKGVFQGTNYDPYDKNQNRPNATSSNLGIGAGGIRIEDGMVAVPRQKDNLTGMLRLGTVIYIPELDRKFLVADLKDERFNGKNMIDFATPKTEKKINSKYNKPFTIQIIRQGNGREDLRDFVKSGEWNKMKNNLIK